MNLYFWLILFAGVVLLAFGAIAGWKNGFAKELEGLLSLLFATGALLLISSLLRDSMPEGISSKALAIALLIVLGVLYSLCRIILGCLRLVAGLPVIRRVDSVLGIAGGLLKTWLILYVVDYLLEIWLNL